MSSLVTTNHRMLPEHLLCLVFAPSVSSKNNSDLFPTGLFVIHLNFLSVNFNNSGCEHALSGQARALPGSRTWLGPKPHRFQEQSPVGSRLTHLCTPEESFAKKLLCLSPLWGRGTVGPPGPPLSVTCTSPEELPSPSPPCSSARQEVLAIKLQMETNQHSIFPFPSPAEQGGMPGKGRTQPGALPGQPSPVLAGRAPFPQSPRGDTADSTSPSALPESKAFFISSFVS